MMKRTIKLLIISLLIITLFSQTVFAVVEVRKTDKSTGEPMSLQTGPDGALDAIKFISSSTGATSGIRYRFTEAKITIGGFTYNLSYENILGGAKPPPGVTEHYEITITRDSILSGIEGQLGRNLTDAEMESFNKSMKNPGDIDIAATIEIYNANTGKVLDTIRSVDEIKSVAGKHGFSSKHMEDMATRFKEGKIDNSEEDNSSGGSGFGTPTGSPKKDNPNSGLRPSIIRP